MCPSVAGGDKFDVSFGKSGVRDIIPVATLLRAAGVDLDAQFDPDSKDDETNRISGIVLVMTFDCEFWFS